MTAAEPPAATDSPAQTAPRILIARAYFTEGEHGLPRQATFKRGEELCLHMIVKDFHVDASGRSSIVATWSVGPSTGRLIAKP